MQLNMDGEKQIGECCVLVHYESGQRISWWNINLQFLWSFSVRIGHQPSGWEIPSFFKAPYCLLVGKPILVKQMPKTYGPVHSWYKHLGWPNHKWSDETDRWLLCQMPSTCEFKSTDCCFQTYFFYFNLNSYCMWCFKKNYQCYFRWAPVTLDMHF